MILYYALLVQYISLALYEWSTGRTAQAVYWVGASIITVGVIMGRS